jgi:hypothetical protein
MPGSLRLAADQIDLWHAQRPVRGRVFFQIADSKAEITNNFASG